MALSTLRIFFFFLHKTFRDSPVPTHKVQKFSEWTLSWTEPISHTPCPPAMRDWYGTELAAHVLTPKGGKSLASPWYGQLPFPYEQCQCRAIHCAMHCVAVWAVCNFFWAVVDMPSIAALGGDTVGNRNCMFLFCFCGNERQINKQTMSC
jgi:hypothetical protein